MLLLHTRAERTQEMLEELTKHPLTNPHLHPTERAHIVPSLHSHLAEHAFASYWGALAQHACSYIMLSVP